MGRYTQALVLTCSRRCRARRIWPCLCCRRPRTTTSKCQRASRAGPARPGLAQCRRSPAAAPVRLACAKCWHAAGWCAGNCWPMRAATRPRTLPTTRPRRALKTAACRTLPARPTPAVPRWPGRGRPGQRARHWAEKTAAAVAGVPSLLGIDWPAQPSLVCHLVWQRLGDPRAAGALRTRLRRCAKRRRAGGRPGDTAEDAARRAPVMREVMAVWDAKHGA